MIDITETDRQAFHDDVSPVKHEKVGKISSSSALSITKVFLYMAIGLLITAVVAFGVGALVYYNFNINETSSDTVATTYLIILISSAVALFIDMIVINFVVIRNKHSILIPGIIYAVLVGVMFSMLTIVVDWKLIGIAFGVTALSFLLMSAISLLSKEMSGLLVVIIGLSIGTGLLALFTWILALTSSSAFNVMYFALMVAILALVMFVAMFDIWRIKKIAEAGAMSNNITLYCAFIMYTDFINVFIRILYFVILIAGKNRS